MTAKSDADDVLHAARASFASGIEALRRLLQRSGERYAAACSEIERRAAAGDNAAIRFCGSADLAGAKARSSRATRNGGRR